ncbi:MAG: radical SAM protein, partial [Candidatus Omnitrophica bacterium]|nr:radical SAM protein [Candidatus Omnitrophota bacterium]
QSVVIQSLFIQGRCDNTGAEDVERWIDQIAVIRPLEVHVYTIDRKPAEAGLKRVETRQLREIAARCQKRTGIPTSVFG